MSAPFVLPDLVKIISADGMTDLAVDVPARVVPCLMKKFVVWNSGTNSQVAAMTHWVDMDDQAIKMDQATLIAALHYSFDYDEGLIIQLSFVGWELNLRSMWQELRYTNTPNYYHRIYCSRITQVLP